MIEFIDFFFNQYLRFFVSIVPVGLILISLYYKFKRQKVTEYRVVNKLIFIKNLKLCLVI